jgi:hypothetical protein
VASVLLLTDGLLAGGLLVAGVVVGLLVAARLMWPKPNPRPGYVERERTFF